MGTAENIRFCLYMGLIALCLFFTRPPRGPTPSLIAGSGVGWEIPEPRRELQLDLPLYAGEDKPRLHSPRGN